MDCKYFRSVYLSHITTKAFDTLMILKNFDLVLCTWQLYFACLEFGQIRLFFHFMNNFKRLCKDMERKCM